MMSVVLPPGLADAATHAQAALPAPDLDYALLAPMLIVFGVAVAGVLADALLPRRVRHPSQILLALGGLVAAFVTVVLLAGTHRTAALGAVAVDGPTLFLQGTILLVSILAVLVMAERRPAAEAFVAQAATVPGSAAEHSARAARLTQSEVYPLTTFAVGGMMLFPAANGLLTLFVALEVLSLPLYLLCGLARHRRLLSQEASLKYFLLGAFSSAIFLYGVALLYGYAGTVKLPDIGGALAAQHGNALLAWIGIGLLAVGLLFKIGAVPFHSWTPDVYQGAPTPITAFMAAATKIAAFGALLRILYVAAPHLQLDWRPLLWAVAIATMVVGVVVAVTQHDVKRMLAYSSVAHAGFILTGLVAADAEGLSSTMFYLLAYGFSSLGAFAMAALVRSGAQEEGELSRWSGLGRRSPLFATTFALFLLAFAGIPLTSGFTSKFAVFTAALSGGALPLVIIGVVTSAIAAFFYVRVIVLMFFHEPPADSPVVVTPSAATTFAVGIAAAVTVMLGVFPQPVLDLAQQAAAFLG